MRLTGSLNKYAENQQLVSNMHGGKNRGMETAVPLRNEVEGPSSAQLLLE